ncbi:hypothetical protein C8R47DRAFT_1322167 [Mycena vitilis]|nr:hypothetical protein C8R47DRAFT_1322167 [Mycena vitilis]
MQEAKKLQEAKLAEAKLAALSASMTRTTPSSDEAPLETIESTETNNIQMTAGEPSSTQAPTPDIPTEIIDELAMVDAPWPFDLGELAPVLLLFGHMGPSIVGSQDRWNELYEQEKVIATTEDMKNTYKILNKRSDLTPIQKLTFKPAVDLTAEERAQLISEFGSDVHPLVQLLEHRRLNPGAFGYRAAKVERTVGGQSKRKGKGKGKRGADEMGEELAKLFKRQRTATTGADDTEDDIFEGPLPELTDSEDEEEEIDDDGQESVERDIDPMLEREEALDDVGADGTWETGPLTLVRDSNRAKCPTRLCKSNEGHAWTVLKPPRSAVRLAGSDAMVAAIVFREKADRERKTLRFVKENSRLYTVGPMDFCGHAKAAKVGQGCPMPLAFKFDESSTTPSVPDVADHWYVETRNAKVV